MDTLFYAAVAVCVFTALSKEDIGLTKSVGNQQLLLEKFSTRFLKTSQWSKVIVLTDDHDFVYFIKYLSRHLISARVASVNGFDLNELNNFGTVLVISRSNTAIEIVKKALKLSYCPSNWLLILEEKFGNVGNFDNFYIPHDVALYLLDIWHFHEVWFIFRLYSAAGNVIKTQKSGFWDSKNGTLKFSCFSVPLPLYSEKALRLTSIPFEPLFSIHKEKGQLTIGGLHGEILKTIESVFLFNATVEVPEDKLFGNKVNASHVSGMFGKLHRNESDIGLSLTRNNERLPFISYSIDITRVRAKLLYHNKAGTEDRFFFYLEPFSSLSWICIMGVTILFAILSSIISFIKNKVLRRPKIAISNVQIIYYYTRSALHVLLYTGIPVQVYGVSGRICLLVFHIFCIVMFISYCSSLTSILAVTRLKLPFNSFHEFLYKSDYDLATLKDSSMVQILKHSKEDLYVRAYKKIISNPDKLLVKSNEDGRDLVYNRKIAYFMEEMTVLNTVRNNCSFRFMDEVLMEADFSFGFNKQFTYKQLFNRYLQILFENGVNRKLYGDRNPDDHNDYCDQMKTAIAAIKIPAVVGLFFTLCLGIAIALIVFSTEMLYKILF